jgi:putative aldouronate transport system permease protein
MQTASAARRRRSFRLTGDKVFDFVNVLVLILLFVSIAYPLYFVLISSFAHPYDVYQGKLTLIPSGFYMNGYQKIFQYQPIWDGYLNTVLYTVFGTALAVAVTVPAAYALSRRELPGGGALMKLFLFTMFFSGGLIPTYMVVKDLNLLDTRFVMYIMGAVSVWNLIIVRSYFQQNIEESLREAAQLDGCGETGFFFRIVLPLSKVIVAVIALYYAVGQWNSFFNALIYLNDAKLYSLQVVLRNLLLANEQAAQSMADARTVAERQLLAEQMKYGVIVVSALPLLLVYPFLQKYFVKGVMVGAVKA